MRKTQAPALLWKRIFAFVIDLLVLDLVVLSPFQHVLAEYLPEKPFTAVFAGQFALTKDLVLLMTTIGLFSLLYFAILEYKLGQSLGKMLFGLRVVHAEQGQLVVWQSVVRSLFLIPVFPFIALWILEPVYMFFDPNNQRLLERWSKTMTVQILPVNWVKIHEE